MKSRGLPNDLVGISGVPYLAFELSRCGIVVLPTTRNTQGYDIIAIRQNGSMQANIQVKAARKRPNFFPMPKSHKVRCGPKEYYVLDWGIAKENEGECFLVKGTEAWDQLRGLEGNQRRRRAKIFPCIFVEGKNARGALGERWQRAWQSWRL